jgi:hypothetical protein
MPCHYAFRHFRHDKYASQKKAPLPCHITPIILIRCQAIIAYAIFADCHFHFRLIIAAISWLSHDYRQLRDTLLLRPRRDAPLPDTPLRLLLPLIFRHMTSSITRPLFAAPCFHIFSHYSFATVPLRHY